MDGKVLTNASAIDRSKTDFYETPKEVTYALMDYLNLLPCKIWEPACGNGAMSKIIKTYDHLVISSDLYDASYSSNQIDFTSSNEHDYLKQVDWIITNPPFKYSEDFIKKAWDSGLPFALLLKSQYWHAKRRTEIFKKYKPSHILALNWRPDFLNGVKGGSPTMECIWVVWDRRLPFTLYDILEKPNY